MSTGGYNNEKSDHRWQRHGHAKALLWLHGKMKCDPWLQFSNVVANPLPISVLCTQGTALINWSSVETPRSNARPITTNPIARLRYAPAVSYPEAC